jgi:2-(1,2-epoxy-1,2-dihydrophenyl)acetyl-CoA isomerase
MASVEWVGDDGVATITIEQAGRRNAMTLPMWHQLKDALEAVADDTTIRVVVLTGAGEDFTSGMDVVGSSVESHPMQRLSVVARTVKKLHDLRLPTIARIDGVAVGAGANLALGCDLVIASDRARLSEIFTHRGLSVDAGGSWLLPRLVGLRRAYELCFLGEMIDAAQALEYGLYTRVVAPQDLDLEVITLARKLAGFAPIALQQTKQLLNDGADSSFAQALESETRAQSINLQGADSAEAFAAFADKREAIFSGGGFRYAPTPAGE